MVLVAVHVGHSGFMLFEAPREEREKDERKDQVCLRRTMYPLFILGSFCLKLEKEKGI